MSYRVEANFAYHRTATTDPTMNEFLDRVDEHLVDALGAKDLLIVSDGQDESFTVALVTGSDDPVTALGDAFSMLRTAFHANDGETPDWPSFTELLNIGIEPKRVELERAAA